jgi:hypothetical protein
MSKIEFHPLKLSGNQLIADLEYADDVALCNSSLDDAQQDLLSLERDSAPAKLAINATKTKFMVVAKPPGFGSTTEEDVASLDLTHICPGCSRAFPTEGSVKSHLNFHWCPADPKCRLPTNPDYVSVPHKRARDVSTAQVRKRRERLSSPSLLQPGAMITGAKRPRGAFRGGRLPASKRRRLDISLFRLAKRDRQLVDSMVKRKKRKIGLSSIKQLSLGFKRLEAVDSFKYLGCLITCDGDENEEIEERIRKAHKAFLAYRGLLTSKRLASSLRLRLFHAYVTSVLLYGSETWHVHKSVVGKMFASFEFRIWSRSGLTRIGLFDRYMRRKARFIGHLLRQPSQSMLFNQLWLPKTREIVENHLGFSLDRALPLALNRSDWQRFVCLSFPVPV